MKFVNLTPHAIKLNDGRIFEPSGIIARVGTKYTKVGDGFYNIEFGDVVNLPLPKKNTYYIVSGMVKGATKRKDVVAPATGHQNVIRNEKGHIVSVPGFII